MAYGTFSPVTPSFNGCIKCSGGFHCDVFFSLSHLVEGLGEGGASGPQDQEWGGASLPPGGALCTLKPFVPLSSDPSIFPTWACAFAISLTWKVNPRIPAKAQQTSSPPGMHLLHPRVGSPRRGPQCSPSRSTVPHSLPSFGLCRCLGHLLALTRCCLCSALTPHWAQPRATHTTHCLWFWALGHHLPFMVTPSSDPPRSCSTFFSCPHIINLVTVLLREWLQMACVEPYFQTKSRSGQSAPSPLSTQSNVFY